MSGEWTVREVNEFQKKFKYVTLTRLCPGKEVLRLGTD